MTPKLIISSLIGVATIGGGTAGCYYYLKSNETEKSETPSTTSSESLDTQPKGDQETPVKAPAREPSGAQRSDAPGPARVDAGRGTTVNQVGDPGSAGVPGAVGP